MPLLVMLRVHLCEYQLAPADTAACINEAVHSAVNLVLAFCIQGEQGVRSTDCVGRAGCRLPNFEALADGQQHRPAK